MKGEKKTPKAPGLTRQVVARNVIRLLDYHYGHLPNITQRERALAKDAGIGFGTVQRMAKGEVGSSIDNIEVVALALQVSVYQLTLSTLDVKNPQVVKGASEDEQRLYRLWRRGKPIAAMQPPSVPEEDEDRP
jgi:transcriptional regulator with XRE-family HTH domain